MDEPVFMLSEEEINHDLKRNLVGEKVNFDCLVEKVNESTHLERDDVKRSYCCGHSIRDFLNQEGHISTPASEILPIVFVLSPTVSIRKVYEFANRQRSVEGLKDLKNLEVIEVGTYKHRRVSFKVNNYNIMKQGMVNSILEHSEMNETEISKRADENLGKWISHINRVSEYSSHLFNKFDNLWHKEREKDKRRAKENKKCKGLPYELLEDFVRKEMQNDSESDILVPYRAVSAKQTM